MNLATLPAEVIQRIIRLEQNSIDNMRLISPQWNTLALEYLNNREHLPIVECVRWAMYEGEEDSLSILIPTAFRRYFGASKWNLRRSINSFEWLLKENVKCDSPDKILIRILQRCSRLKKLEITMMTGQFERPMETVSRVLSSKTIIEELSISNAEYFHPSVLEAILNAAGNRWVQRVVLSPSPAYINSINHRHFKAHYEFVLNVLICLGRIDMTFTDYFSQTRKPSFDAYWDLKRAALSTKFKIDISPIWRTMAQEHLNNRNHLPIIECIRWFMYEDDQDILSMHIPTSFRSYFGASKWSARRSNGSLIWLLNEDVERGCPDEFLTRILQRCSRLKKLEINMISGKFERPKDEVSRALSGDTIIEELSISNAEYFHPSVLDAILHAVRDRYVQRVVLSPSPAYIDNINHRHFKAHCEFVLNVAKCLGRIDMTSTDFFSQQRQPSFDAYWDLKRATLSTQFKIDVTKEIEPISANTNRVRFVLRA